MLGVGETVVKRKISVVMELAFFPPKFEDNSGNGSVPSTVGSICSLGNIDNQKNRIYEKVYANEYRVCV